MKHVFKKNQIMIAVLTVMIAVAGYLNFSGRLFKPPTKNAREANAQLAEKELLDISEEELEAANDDIQINEGEVEGTPGEAVLTNAGVDPTVAQAKLLREQVRAQNKETLQDIIDNPELTDDEKQSAVNQMVKMTEFSEKEMAIEMLMASKGFSEAVVNLTEGSADIVVEKEELTDACRAQIEDIVMRKTDIPPENIVITPIHRQEE